MVTYNYISSKDPLVFHIFPYATNICSQSTNVGASFTSDMHIEPSNIQSLSHENVLKGILMIGCHNRIRWSKLSSLLHHFKWLQNICQASTMRKISQFKAKISTNRCIHIIKKLMVVAFGDTK